MHGYHEVATFDLTFLIALAFAMGHNGITGFHTASANSSAVIAHGFVAKSLATFRRLMLGRSPAVAMASLLRGCCSNRNSAIVVCWFQAGYEHAPLPLRPRTYCANGI